MLKTVMIRSALLLFAFAISIAARAYAADPRQLDIPAGDLAAGLEALAKQAGVEFVYQAEQVKGLQTKGISGTFTAEEAVMKLLDGTPLTLRKDSSGAILIAPPKASVATSRGASATPDRAGAAVRLAQAEPVGNSSQQSGEEGVGDSGKVKSGASESAGSARMELEEVLVTGTYIRGVQDVAAPAITLTRADFEKAGFSTIQDVMASLPQNMPEIGVAGGVGTGVSRTAASNTERAAGVSLRGLGPEATLVLLNGKRRPGTTYGAIVDISVIPLSLIERIEVVTGGRSAVYGSDAVAGVVNLVTRRDFDGAETQIQYGMPAHDGGESLQLSQIVGKDFESGGFVAAYDYARAQPLDILDTGTVRLPSSFGFTTTALTVVPDTRRHSGFLSGHVELGDHVQAYLDALYTSNKNVSVLDFQLASGFAFSNTTEISSDQYSVSGGARMDIGDTWSLDTSGVYGLVDNSFVQNGIVSASRPEMKLSSLSSVADGPLFSVGGVDVKAAVGVEWRKESITDEGVGAGLDEDRSIRSAFGEINLPLVAEEDQRPGFRRIELSLAARYDSYSDFGKTFNPQAGLLWNPVKDLTLRAAYSEAFQAPRLFLLGFGNQVLLENTPDTESASGTSPILRWVGANPSLEPEKAYTWSAGFDYRPQFAEWGQLSVSYFDINYRNRVDEPVQGADNNVILQNPAIQTRYANLIDRDPSAAELAAILATRIPGPSGLINRTGTPFNPLTQNLLDVFPDLVLLDNRRHNVAVDEISGIDLRADSKFATNAGLFSLGLSGTYYLELTRRVTPLAPSFNELNRQGKPVDLRLRANAGWTRGAWGIFTYVNYVDDYRDTTTSPPGTIDDWLTVDCSLRFDGSELHTRGFLNGFTATLSIDNLLDEDPPEFLSNAFGIGYDPANANALGRFVSLRLVKRWGAH